MDPAYGRAITELFSAMTSYRDGWQTLTMVAPATQEEKWHNLSTLLDGHAGAELKGAVEQLGAAWRAGDAGQGQRGDQDARGGGSPG